MNWFRSAANQLWCLIAVLLLCQEAAQGAMPVPEGHGTFLFNTPRTFAAETEALFGNVQVITRVNRSILGKIAGGSS